MAFFFAAAETPAPSLMDSPVSLLRWPVQNWFVLILSHVFPQPHVWRAIQHSIRNTGLVSRACHRSKITWGIGVYPVFGAAIGSGRCESVIAASRTAPRARRSSICVASAPLARDSSGPTTGTRSAGNPGIGSTAAALASVGGSPPSRSSSPPAAAPGASLDGGGASGARRPGGRELRSRATGFGAPHAYGGRAGASAH